MNFLVLKKNWASAKKTCSIVFQNPVPNMYPNMYLNTIAKKFPRLVEIDDAYDIKKYIFIFPCYSNVW